MDELTSDALTADYRVLQRKRGHRYSLDDVLTAYVACEAEPEAAEVLDLGTGIGSVLMMVAWKRPAARLVGVEAQEGSYALLQENLEANGLAARVRTIHGDFREPEVRAAIGGRFSLVTGTPPYFPPGTASVSPDPQRAYARVELRGGVEAYVETASLFLDDEGTFVVCAGAGAEPRVRGAADRHGLFVHARLDAIPRRGRAPLFSVYTLRRSEPETTREGAFVAREADGTRTAEYVALRAYFGLTQKEDRG